MTSFATFGRLGDVGLLVNNSIATGPDKVLIVIGLGAAEVVVAVYIFRGAIFAAKNPESKVGP